MSMKPDAVRQQVMAEMAAGLFDHIMLTASNVPPGRVAGEFVTVRGYRAQPGPLCKVTVDCKAATAASVSKAVKAALGQYAKAIKDAV